MTLGEGHQFTVKNAETKGIIVLVVLILHQVVISTAAFKHIFRNNLQIILDILIGEVAFDCSLRRDFFWLIFLRSTCFEIDIGGCSQGLIDGLFLVRDSF